MSTKAKDRSKTRLVIRVVEIHGHCPVYKLGDKIVLNGGYRMNLQETDAVCMHSLASLLPYYNLVASGAEMDCFGLLKKGDPTSAPRVRCLDPFEYTGGGSVTFEFHAAGRSGSSGENQ